MRVYQIPISSTTQSLTGLEDHFIIIVNIASECGFNAQLRALNLFAEQTNYPAKVIAFPSNQFKQHHISNDSSPQWCERTFNTNYTIEDEIEVNGPNAHPLFKYLKQKAPGVFGERVMWNFTKFLILPQEKSIKRFAPQTNIAKIDQYIISLLEKEAQ